MSHPHLNTKIEVHDKTSTFNFFIRLCEICLVKADNGNCHIFLNNKKEYVLTITLEKFMNRYQSLNIFYKVHRSEIINISADYSINRTTYAINFENGLQSGFSEKGLAGFDNFLDKYNGLNVNNQLSLFGQ